MKYFHTFILSVFFLGIKCKECIHLSWIVFEFVTVVVKAKNRFTYLQCFLNLKGSVHWCLG